MERASVEFEWSATSHTCPVLLVVRQEISEQLRV